MKKKIVLLTFIFTFLFSQAVYAKAATSPYDTLLAARSQTHKGGAFRLRGDETSITVETLAGKTGKTARYYHVSGYDAGGEETYLQFDSRMPDPKTGVFIGGAWSTRTSFLLTTESIYIKTSSPLTEWTERDLTAMLPKLIALGTLDQFFMLELLNSNRLSLYAPYLSAGADATIGGAACTTVKADISRAQFAELADELTMDVKSLLGSAAEGLSDTQLAFMQVFARGMLNNLDAEAHFIFYIEKENGRIARIDTKMDMADPYGNRAPGAVSRIQSEAVLTLYDFGKDITRVIP